MCQTWVREELFKKSTSELLKKWPPYKQTARTLDYTFVALFLGFGLILLLCMFDYPSAWNTEGIFFFLGGWGAVISFLIIGYIAAMRTLKKENNNIFKKLPLHGSFLVFLVGSAIIILLFYVYDFIIPDSFKNTIYTELLLSAFLIYVLYDVMGWLTNVFSPFEQDEVNKILKKIEG